MKSSWKTGLSFGLTSGVMATLGLMVGLHAGTHSRNVVLGAFSRSPRPTPCRMPWGFIWPKNRRTADRRFTCVVAVSHDVGDWVQGLKEGN